MARPFFSLSRVSIARRPATELTTGPENLLSNPSTLSPQAMQAQSAPSSTVPTRVRWRIMLIVMFIMAVTTLCRLNLSIAGKYISEEFSFDTITMGRVFSAFLWGYGLFQIPWGYIGDRFGPRRTLTISMLLFCVGTAALGIAPKLALSSGISVLLAFQVIRFITGVGEAASSANVTRVIASWTAARERGFASGLQTAGLGLGGTLTPIFISWTMIHWGWRISFYLCAAIAFIVLCLWWYYCTDWPEQHPSVNAAELALIHPEGRKVSGRKSETVAKRKPVPWGRLLSSGSIWGLILGYGCQGYAFYVYYNWFYFYAVKVRGLGIMQAAAWTSFPFLAMTLISPLGGLFSDTVSRNFGRRRGRQCAVWVGMGLSAALLFSGSHTANTSLALPMMALAAGFLMFAAANFWAACIDLVPDHSATLSALMNTLGSVGGAISSTVTAYIATQYSWTRALDLAAAVTVVSGLLWFFVDAGKSLEEKSA
jgi:ACS family glucarate transporter-like MFS transporter